MIAPRTLFSGFLPVGLAVFLKTAPAAAEPLLPPSVPAAPDQAAAPLPPSAPPAVDLPPPNTRWNVLFTGLAVTGVSYGLALGASYAFPDARMANELRIPVAGPWMAIADTGCAADDPDCSTVMLVFTAVLAGMDGVLQAGGLAIALESAFLPVASPKSRSSTTPTLRPVPYVAGKDAMGLGLAGTF